jgi:prophage maintenance system killer protein
MENKIIIYQTSDNQTVVEVNFDNETAWLSLNQMSSLFERDKSVISRHIQNIFKERELSREATVAKFATVQNESGRNIERAIEYYNLDVIISVGYRVKSTRGTQFRQWASQRLKDFLIEGVAINEKRLAQQNKEIKLLHDGIRIISRAIEEIAANNEYEWLRKFSLGLELLDDYDHATLDKKGRNIQTTQYPTLENFLELVEQMRTDFNSGVFGLEKDDSFRSAINQIRQSFNNQDLYPSIEEKAAMLLYLVVKNYAFVDGNKRIAAASFILFLERNGLLYKSNGETLISNEALARSNPVCGIE